MYWKKRNKQKTENGPHTIEQKNIKEKNKHNTKLRKIKKHTKTDHMHTSLTDSKKESRIITDRKHHTNRTRNAKEHGRKVDKKENTIRSTKKNK